jgi:hypothetical protein
LCNMFWLVVWNMAFIFHHTYGMSSFPLSNSYFSRWWNSTTKQWYMVDFPARCSPYGLVSDSLVRIKRFVYAKTRPNQERSEI